MDIRQRVEGNGLGGEMKRQQRVGLRAGHEQRMKHLLVRRRRVRLRNHSRSVDRQFLYVLEQFLHGGSDPDSSGSDEFSFDLGFS